MPIFRGFYVCKLRRPGIIMGHLPFMFASTQFFTPLHLSHTDNSERYYSWNVNFHVHFKWSQEKNVFDGISSGGKKQQRKNWNDLVCLCCMLYVVPFHCSSKHSLNTYHFSVVKLSSLWSFRIMASNNKHLEGEQKADNVFISTVYVILKREWGARMHSGACPKSHAFLVARNREHRAYLYLF